MSDPLIEALRPVWENWEVESGDLTIVEFAEDIRAALRERGAYIVTAQTLAAALHGWGSCGDWRPMDGTAESIERHYLTHRQDAAAIIAALGES